MNIDPREAQWTRYGLLHAIASSAAAAASSIRAASVVANLEPGSAPHSVMRSQAAAWDRFALELEREAQS